MIYRITASNTGLYREDKPYHKAYRDGNDEYGLPVWRIEVNSLEELMNIVREAGHPVIIDEQEIEIYNDYRE